MKLTTNKKKTSIQAVAVTCRSTSMTAIVPCPLLSKIPSVLAGQIVSFLPFEETLRFLLLTPRARSVLALQAAWDPLILDQRSCNNLIRYLMKWGPHRCVPPGIYHITELRADVASVDFTGDPRMRYLHSVCTFQSLCQVLQERFTHLARLDLKNIEDCNIDFDDEQRGLGFLAIRSSILADFKSVLLQVSEMHPKGKHSCTQAFYRLTAAKEGNLPLTSVAESLFLKEHNACRQSDSDFCVAHARQRIFSRESVQKHYEPVFGKSRSQQIKFPSLANP